MEITELAYNLFQLLALAGSIVSVLIIGFYIFFVRKSSPYTQNEDPEGKRYKYFKIQVYKLSIAGVFFLCITAVVSILISLLK
ncbi:hypothetical protein BGM24_25860 [Bacillus sp. FJAT-26377]|nr:hypothetical protein [Bacillus sp. FJAT-26377]